MDDLGQHGSITAAGIAAWEGAKLVAAQIQKSFGAAEQARKREALLAAEKLEREHKDAADRAREWEYMQIKERVLKLELELNHLGEKLDSTLLEVKELRNEVSEGLSKLYDLINQK